MVTKARVPESSLAPPDRINCFTSVRSNYKKNPANPECLYCICTVRVVLAAKTHVQGLDQSVPAVQCLQALFSGEMEESWGPHVMLGIAAELRHTDESTTWPYKRNSKIGKENNKLTRNTIFAVTREGKGGAWEKDFSQKQRRWYKLAVTLSPVGRG